MIFSPGPPIGHLAGEVGAYDLAFRYLEPAAYFEIVEKLGKTRQEQSGISRQSRDAGRAAELAGIKRRSLGAPNTSTASTTAMRTQQIDFEQIGDIMALRVIVQTVGDCYAARASCTTCGCRSWGCSPTTSPAPRATSTSRCRTKVLGPHSQPMEVQIRTAEMHRTAGTASPRIGST